MILACDLHSRCVSAYGIGAMIVHVLPDGSERLVVFTSHTLTNSEKNCAQVDLSLIVGTKHFHAYLYGRPFKPVTAILGPKMGIPPLVAARLQRWAWILSERKYEIEFRPTGDHGNADGLLTLPDYYRTVYNVHNTRVVEPAL